MAIKRWCVWALSMPDAVTGAIKAQAALAAMAIMLAKASWRLMALRIWEFACDCNAT